MEVVNIVWIIIGILIAICIAYYVYIKKYKIDEKDFVPNNEYNRENKNYECILFYTTWCPHCKKTLEDWKKYTLSNPKDNAVYNVYDCDKDVEKAEFYEIDSYPTIIMLYKEKKYIFDSNFTEESMDKFVNTILKI